MHCVPTMKIINKKAQFNYILLERLEAGIVLEGSEAKALRISGVDLSNSYAKIVGGQAYLINAIISIKGKKDYNQTRTRKLLLHKDQIISILSKVKAKKLTLIPTKLYNKQRLVKLELALAKPKRKFEKRQALKKKDIEREIAQELGNRYQ